MNAADDMTKGARPHDQAGGLGMEGIHHAYGRVKVVRGVGLHVRPGELACLLGPSGCGKTTLLRLAAGLEVAQQGWITIGDKLVANGATDLHVPPEQRGVGLMFQDYALFPHLSVRDNIAFGLPRKTAERTRWIDDALARLGLSDMAEAYPHTLSGGQQQRVALLRATAPEPRVLLLDEPFSGLDVTRRAQMREETLDLVKETGAASLMVTHDPEEAMFMADRIFIMNEGRIIQAAPPREIYHEPVNAFVASLFGHINRCDGTVRNGRVTTPLGHFAAPGIGEGMIAQVMIRPEALHVMKTGETHTSGMSPRVARVVSARLLGRSAHLRLAIEGEDENGSNTLVEARIPGTSLLEEGEQVMVSVNPDLSFVFPAP